MTELEPRGVRHEIANREYEGRESLEGAFADRPRMSTAVEAAKRARVDAAEWMWNAREAERTLGRMILEAREAGDLTDRGGDRHSASSQDVPDLKDLGIPSELATLAVKLARLPDNAWQTWHKDVEPTQTKVSTAADEYWARVKVQEGRVRTAEEEAARIRREAEAAKKRLKQAQQERPVVPPLRDEETNLTGADVALTAAVGAAEPQGPTTDRSVESVQQAVMVAAMGGLAKRVEGHDPHLSSDAFRDVNVMAARDAVRRLTDAAAVWLRTLNALYEEGIDK